MWLSSSSLRSPVRSCRSGFIAGWYATAGSSNWPGCWRAAPHFGDQLLGVIELVHSDSELTRSRTLRSGRAPGDRRREQTRPQHRGAEPEASDLGLAGRRAGGGGLALFLLFPAAASNAWARLIAPWRPIPRYTFAAIKPLPDRLVVPHGEPFTAEAKLEAATAWRLGPW